MSNQPQKTQKTFYQRWQENQASAAAMGWEMLPADHPVYKQGGYTILPVNIHPDWRKILDQEKKEAFIAAVHEGDVAKVRSLLEPRLLNCICDEREFSPLMCAIENNHESLVEFLLNAGASPNIPGYRDETRTRKICSLELAESGDISRIVKSVKSSINPNQPVTRKYLESSGIYPETLEQHVQNALRDTSPPDERPDYEYCIPDPGPARPPKKDPVTQWLITTPMGTRHIKLYENHEDGITSYFVTDGYGYVITTDPSGQPAETLSFEYAAAVYAQAAGVDPESDIGADHVIDAIEVSEECPTGIELDKPLPEGFSIEGFLWRAENVAQEDLTFFGYKRSSESDKKWTIRLLNNPDSWYCGPEDLLEHALEIYKKELAEKYGQ